MNIQLTELMLKIIRKRQNARVKITKGAFFTWVLDVKKTPPSGFGHIALACYKCKTSLVI